MYDVAFDINVALIPLWKFIPQPLFEKRMKPYKT